MENIFNERQIKIIKLLCNTDKTLSSKVLSDEINCSTKTIQNEIKNINFISNNKINIQSVQGKGYKINYEQEFLDKLTNTQNSKFYDRKSYIIKRLIEIYKSKDSITLERLADEIYVSISTLKNDVKDIKSILSDFDLKIVSKHKSGIMIDGDIENIKKFILLINSINKNLIIDDFLDKKILKDKILIKKILLSNITKEEINFTDFEFLNLYNYILVSLSFDNKYNYNDCINSYMKIFKNELVLKNNESIKNKNSIFEAIDEFTRNLKDATSIDITKDLIFKEYLYQHINSLIIQNRIYSDENIDIKTKYPFIFQLSKIAKKTLENKLDIKIDDNEIYNISIHIGGALDRIDYESNNKILKAIIICSSGIGTSMLIKSKIEDKYSDRIEILKVIPLYLIDYISLFDVDFIISTVDCGVENNIPIVKISPFLNEEDIKLINKFLDTGKIHNDLEVKTLFERDLFFIDLNFDNKYDVINFLSQKLLDKGYIDEETKNYYIERENIGTTEIGNLVSIPHGRNKKINKNILCVGILKQQIYWDIGNVRLVLMLCLNNESTLNYEDIFLQIYKRVDSISKVISICENKNFDKFISLFQKR